MRTLILGIDPGLTGAIAAIDTLGDYVGVRDLPIVRDGRCAWIHGPDLLEIVRELRGADRVLAAFVERSQAMPRSFSGGNVGAWSQGATFASTVATLQILGVPLELVQPAAWKRKLGLIGDGERDLKADAIDRARLMFPDAPLERKKDHGRAEALLIARFGLDQRRRAAA